MTQYAKEDIKCEGTMQKKGGMRWQKRYFILYQSGSRPAHLAYFKDEKDDGARATLELTSDTKVDLLLGKAHAFQVILRGECPYQSANDKLCEYPRDHQSCTGRALKVAAETHEDREKWMKCLRDCIAMAISQTMVHVRSPLMRTHVGGGHLWNNVVLWHRLVRGPKVPMPCSLPSPRGPAAQ